MSLSSADRDARIAEIEGRVTAWCVASGVNHAEFMRNLAVTVLDEFPTGSTAGDRMNKIGVLAGIDAPWLIAELRAALSREEEAKKARKAGYVDGFARGYTIRVVDHIGHLLGKEHIDAITKSARSVAGQHWKTEQE